MPQAARVVSRVFLDGVASVVSGTAALELGSVTSRSRPVRIVASALFLLSVEHKQEKTPIFSSQPGLDEARAVTRWTPAAARARIKRIRNPAELTCTANSSFDTRRRAALWWL